MQGLRYIRFGLLDEGAIGQSFPRDLEKSNGRQNITNGLWGVVVNPKGMFLYDNRREKWAVYLDVS